MKRFLLSAVILATSLQLQAQTTYSLEDCRRMATTHNKEMQIAGEKVTAAEHLRKAARTQYLPNLAANGGYVRNQKNISLLGEDMYAPIYSYSSDGTTIDYANSWNNEWTVVDGTAVPLDANGTPFNPSSDPDKILWKNKAYIPKDAFELNTKNIFAGAITITQPLFMGGKIRELNRIADSNKKLAEASLEGQTSETIVNTDVAYWRIVSLVNKEKLAKSYVSLLKKLEGDVEKAIAFGVSTKSDGLSVKVKLNEAEMSLLQVEDGLKLSHMALCQICGLPLETSFTLEDETLDELPKIPETSSVTETSINNRYEVKSLEQMVNMAESSRKIELSRFMPNAALTAGYLVSNPNSYNGYENEFGGEFQVGVVVNVPLFHFGERIHTLRSAESEKRQAIYKLDETKEKIELDITQARFKTNESVRKALMTASNKEKAEENLRYASIGFEAGTINASTLMEAQTAWLKAHSDHIDAQIDAQLCKVYLQKALGTLK
jgi:outer membrane protein